MHEYFSGKMLTTHYSLSLLCGLVSFHNPGTIVVNWSYLNAIYNYLSNWSWYTYKCLSVQVKGAHLVLGVSTPSILTDKI